MRGYRSAWWKRHYRSHPAFRIVFPIRIRRIPGVVLASPLENGRALVERSALTAVITGTAGWEALLLRRPALVLGDAPYTAVGEGLVRCSDPDGLPRDVGEPEYVVRTEGTWHVHNGGWSADSTKLVYTRDMDYGDIYELVDR